MDERAKQLLKDCVEDIENFDGDISILQAEFDNKVKKYENKTTENQEFEPIYNGRAFTEEELSNIKPENEKKI